MKNLLATAAAFAVLLSGKAAAQSYTYTTQNSQTTITGFSAEPSGAIVVPATLGGFNVVAIDRSAFKDRAGITGITFASGALVTKIGPMAFQGCTGLQSISLPTGSPMIPAAALQGCTSLASVTIPSTVTSIGSSAFAGCTSLASITLPTSLTTLGEAAFLDCRNLASVTVPIGVTSLPAQVFSECRALATISLPNAITQIGDSAFHNCSAITSFTLPSSVTSVGTETFYGCTAMTTLEINASLATLGSRALDQCGGLLAINVSASNTSFSSTGGILFNKAKTTLIRCPEGLTGSYAIPATVTTLADAAFSHCDTLTSISLPSSLTTIPADGLYYAAGLTSLTLPPTITSVGSWAFAGCAGLSGVTLPSGITSIGDDAFHHSKSLAWALFQGSAPAMGTTVFDHTAAGFTICYYASATGFTSPTWSGYPATALTAPAAFVSWLTTNGYSPATSGSSDTNGDGVSLLLAYALGLDPSQNLSTSLPKPAVTANGLTLTFQGNSAGITYAIETSTDLATWQATGASLTSPDANGLRTATLTVGSGARFMRLAAGY